MRKHKHSAGVQKIIDENNQRDQEARSKGWMPAKPFKGRITESMIGRHIRIGWTDTKPSDGVIIDVGEAVDDTKVFLFNELEIARVDSRDQIFFIADKVQFLCYETKITKQFPV